MGACVNIGIDAQRDAGLAAELAGDARDVLELRPIAEPSCQGPWQEARFHPAAHPPEGLLVRAARQAR